MKKINIIKIFKSPFIKGDVRRTGGFKSGQVAIIVMLVSAIMITLGLSLSKKTTVETKIDYNEEALKKAFNAAESGIDYYLATGEKTYDSTDNLSEANVAIENIGGGNDELNFGEFTAANGVQYFWLTNHDLGGSLGTGYYSGSQITVSHGWTNNYGSLDINIYNKNASGVYGVKRYGYNFNTNISTQVNNFTSLGNVSIVQINFIPVNPILMTITPIFSGANLSINGNGNFPVQGEKINSTGSAGVVFGEAGEESKINKKLSIERRYKFPYFLLSGIVSENSVLSQLD